ncbi:hypothetical protein TWF694_010286 [Orbilia ellipsospora]|uniref:Telomere replication protein EST3 n=1 Tax=Orbilia ellipsospora TaxID=2528407 RepID=A0AAV9X9R3_9PEZI
MNLLREFIRHDLDSDLKTLLEENKEARIKRRNTHAPAIQPIAESYKTWVNDPAIYTYQDKLVKLVDFSPPRYIASPSRDQYTYIQILRVNTKIETGKSFSALVGDGFVSIDAFFKLDSVKPNHNLKFLESLSQIQPGAVLQLRKYRFRFPGTCRQGFSEGLRRGDQLGLAKVGEAGGSAKVKVPGFYSTVAEISTLLHNINLPRAKDPCLEVDEFTVLGGDDHMYGDLEPVGRIPAIKACVDALPVSPVSIPSVEQWSRLFVQVIAEIWYMEIAWLKFSQTLSAERIGNGADLKTAFTQNFQPSRRAVLNATRKVTKLVFEPMYQEAGIAARLFEVRQTFKDIRKLFDVKSPDPPQKIPLIPGTRRPLPRRRNIPPRNASPSQGDVFTTQTFQTQFFPVDSKVSRSSTNTDSGPELELTIRNFKLEPLDENAIAAFSGIIRSLYEEARDGHLREKGVTAIHDHILDFYAARALSTLQIERTTHKAPQHSHTKKIIRSTELPTKKPSHAQLEKSQDIKSTPPNEPSGEEPTMTHSGVRPMISRENLIARLARLSNSNLKSGTSKKSSKLKSGVTSIAQDINSTPGEPRKPSPTNSSRGSSLPAPPHPPHAPSFTKASNREAPGSIKAEVVDTPKQEPLPSVKTKKKKQERLSSPISSEIVLEPLRPTQNHAVPRGKQKSQPSMRTPQTPPPKVKVKKVTSPKIKIEEVEMDLAQDNPVERPEPEPMQVEQPAPAPSPSIEPEIGDLTVENIDFTTQSLEPEDLLTCITNTLNLIRQEQEYDKILPDRAVVPQDQAEMLSKNSALWPPPKMELQKHLHKQPKLGLKENENTTTAANPPEQHVFTLTNQPVPEEEEEAEIEWEATPKSQLKDPKVNMIQEEGQGQESDNDSDAESYLNDQPPPASSAEQHAVPAELLLAQKEHQNFMAQTKGSSGPAMPKSSPPRAHIPGYRMPSSPAPTSTPNTPMGSRKALGASNQLPGAARSPSPTTARVLAIVDDSPGEAEEEEEEEEEEEAQNKDDDYDDETEEEEPEGQMESIVQVLQTQTTTHEPENSTQFETATENQSGQTREEEEMEERSPQRVISSSQLDRPVTPPTISPGGSKRKAEEMESSPVKAGSLASPRIIRNTKVVKVDESLAMRNFRFLGKQFNAAVASSKAGVRRALKISEDELNQSDLESLEEKRRREREEFFGDDD